jgi:uncharacterized protein YcbK (DUF882 family)
MIKLSEHFSLQEMTKTYVKGFNNIPNATQTNNLKRLCGWLDRLRHEWNNRYGDGDDPIIINSAFRSPSINKAVGGSSTSNHLSGCAADIRVQGMEQLMRYATILLDISDRIKEDFDELLMERKSNSLWLHFAVRESGNRRHIKFIG